MKESVYVGDRETRSCDLPALAEIPLKMVNSVTCADIAQSHCGEGGNVPGAQNLEEGVDMSVCLSALWFLLTIRKPCWSVPRRLAAPGDTLLSWGSSFLA